jgi:N-acetylmuramoyl-L-alanine amidase
MTLRRLFLLLLVSGLTAPELVAQETRVQIPVASTATMLDDESKCLALAVYWEGKSETPKGQLAVAHTVLNRVRNPKFPDTICGVVSQQSDTGRRSCQFSWWCDGKRDEPRDEDGWQDAVSSARDAMAAGAKDPTQGALYFHSARIKAPKWTKNRKRLARIGNHIFYR